MPIEIKELHIRVSVTAPQPNGQPDSGKTGSGGAPGHDDKEAIVAECVEQVLQILQNKMER
ncbi:MAG: DUF5908 family protein [Methylovulum miyakonense]|uniref:DUF5908 family protein n=1 Tax=Methylovulum miyakonense TaxID=645578 RepID=UPI003BB55B31